MENEKTLMWAGISVGSLLLGLLFGYNFAQHSQRNQKQWNEVTQTMPSDAKELILDALHLQATVRAADKKYDASQRETISLLIPAKLDEFKHKPLSGSDLSGIEAMYSLIEQPNGLRVARSK